MGSVTWSVIGVTTVGRALVVVTEAEALRVGTDVTTAFTATGPPTTAAAVKAPAVLTVPRVASATLQVRAGVANFGRPRARWFADVVKYAAP